AAGLGGARRLKAGTTIGVVPFGLTDGYRPARAGQAVMLVRGRRTPVLGVSLEATTLDLTGVPEPALGDEVVVLGEQANEAIALEEVAHWQEHNPLEVLMTFNGRVPARYLDGTRERSEAARVQRRGVPRSLYYIAKSAARCW